MKYVILIYSNPRSRALWNDFSQSEKADGFRAYEVLTAELAASGELLAAEALADPSAGKRLEATDRQVLMTDGPFAEGKEHLAGFVLVQCESFDRATAIAARVPEADLGLVEVRPIMSLSSVES